MNQCINFFSSLSDLSEAGPAACPPKSPEVMEEEAKLVRQSDSVGGGPYINALMQ
jgi:hypothetical protein